MGNINIHSTEVSYDLEDLTMENLEDIHGRIDIPQIIRDVFYQCRTLTAIAAQVFMSDFQ